MGAACGAVLIVAVALAVHGSSGDATAMHLPAGDAEIPLNDPSIEAASPTTVLERPISPPSESTSTVASLSHSNDGSGSKPVANIVEHGGRQYGLGAPGDVVVVGDWNCDGKSTPAILQAATGRVAVFNGWPGIDGTLMPTFNGISSDATSIMADHLDSCDILRAVGPYGSTIITQGNP